MAVTDVFPSGISAEPKRELLEIAKANAASLKKDSRTSENGNSKENLDFKNIMPRPLALKSTSLLSKNLVVSPTREEKKGSVSQWIPAKNEENVLFHNFSPKSTTFRAS